MKKIVSIMLTLVLILSSSVSAFAENTATITSGEENSNSASHKVTASYISSGEDDSEKEQGSSEKMLAQSGAAAALVSETESEAEVKWGNFQESLTNSGTLAEAIDAAGKDENVKYIQLQKDLNINAGHEIVKGAFTFDLNGKSITASSTVFFIGANTQPDDYVPMVTFTDSNSGGKISTVGKSGTDTPAIWIARSEVIFEKGSYEGPMALYVDENTVVTIKDGSFIGEIYSIGNDGSVTIEGGSFKSNNTGIYTRGDVTIKGGVFETDERQIAYHSGMLDLSNYTDISKCGEFKIYNEVVNNKLVENYIVLPTNYCLTRGSEPDVLLEPNTLYYVVPKSTLSEAAWGSSAENLSSYGTLQNAFDAAKLGEKNVKYIQLLKNIELTDSSSSQLLMITGGKFTFDLNGKKVSSTVDSPIFLVNKGEVTFTDISAEKSGRIESTSGSAEAVVSIFDGNAVFNGGSYKGYNAVQVVAGEVSISGGTFEGKNYGIVCNSSGTVTISSGTVSSEENACIFTQGNTIVTGGKFIHENNGNDVYYSSGALDLSGYKFDAESKFYILCQSSDIWVNDDSKDTIKLPEGYCLSKDGSTVFDKLETGVYEVIPEPETCEAKWGTSDKELPYRGTLAAAFEAANKNAGVTYIQLQTDVNGRYQVHGLGNLIFDLNGKTLRGTNDKDDGVVISIYSENITFKDSGSGGKVIGSTGNDVIAVHGKAVFTGGTYEASGYGRALSIGRQGDVDIKGGTFKAASSGTNIENQGTLTISGGTISGGAYYVKMSEECQKTTISGGSFSGVQNQHIMYRSGELDLSGYESGITDFKICNAEEGTPVSKFNLPTGYGLSINGTALYSGSELKYGTYQVIASDGESGGNPDSEAKWGTAADNLTKSGTLSDAFKAAGEDSSIKYIQLQKDKTLESVINLSVGNFTLDLNGKTINGELGIVGADVTFADSSSDGMGKVSNNALNEPAIWVLEGKAAFTGGTYEGCTALMVEPTTSVTIRGGVFKGIDKSEYVIDNAGSMTISGGTISGGDYCLRINGDAVVTGGTFTGAKEASIIHWSGKLDLSKHTGSMSDYTIKNFVDIMYGASEGTNVVYSPADDSTEASYICLPGGYGLADVKSPNTVVSEFCYDMICRIVSRGSITPAPTAKAEITEVKIVVKNVAHSMGNFVLTKDSSAVRIEVLGNNFDKLSSSNILYYADGRSSEVGSNAGWTVDAENGIATKTFAADHFVNCSSAYEVKYSNDGGVEKTGTGIYIQYQSNVKSVQIKWGTLDFTYSDVQVDGADEGWTYEAGENQVEVTNCDEGGRALNVTVSYTSAEGYSGIVGEFGGSSSKTLELKPNTCTSFDLELSGKPESALSNAVIGSVTVTIEGGE